MKATLEPFRVVPATSSGELLVACRGISLRVLQQVVVASREEHIRQWVPRDAAERFSNTARASLWLHNQRGLKPYSLLDECGRLAGFGWGMPTAFPAKGETLRAAFAKTKGEPIPDDTLDIRIYGRHRGEGLAERFAGAVAVDYAAQRMAGPRRGEAEFSGLWAHMAAGNKRAKDVYSDLDFVKTNHGVTAFEEITVYDGRTIMMIDTPTLGRVASIAASRNAALPLDMLTPHEVFRIGELLAK